MAADDRTNKTADPTPGESSVLCSAPVPLLHDAEETSEILGGAVSAYWLKRRAGRRQIPHTRIGQSAWWSDTDIERLIAENYCDPRTYGRKAKKAKSRS